MSEDSAIPEQLIDYSGWAQGQDTTLQQTATRLNQSIEAFNTSGRSPGIVGSIPYAGNDGVAYAARNTATDQWVGQVGQAFLNIARSQLPPGVAKMPDVNQSLAQSPVTATDQQLAALVGDDPVKLAEKQEAASTLAAKLDEAIWTNNPAAIQALLAELAKHQDDPEYNSAFFKQLGVSDTLYLAYQLGNPKYAGGNNSLRIFDQALASATNSQDWDPSFNQGLFAPVDKSGLVPYGAINLLKFGTYSEDFLVTAGDAELKLGPDQQPTDAQTAAITLQAIARNPQAALDFLTSPPSSWPSGAPPRLALILEHYGQDIQAGGNDPVAGGLAALLRAAGSSPDASSIVIGPTGQAEPEVQVLLQTLGSMPSQMIPPSLGPAIADVISQHIDIFVPSVTGTHVNAPWTWQEQVFKEAESSGTGSINMNAVTELQNAIEQWGLDHQPPTFSYQSANINQWTKYLLQMGSLWGLTGLPIRQAPYDAAALREARITALSDFIGLIPFGNFVPAKYELTQLIVGEGGVLLNEVGTQAVQSNPNTPDQKADDTEYQQLGAMNMALTTQFLAAHPDLLPPGADFTTWVREIASGKAPLGDQTPTAITQFRTDLYAADTNFLETYNNPGRGGS